MFMLLTYPRYKERSLHSRDCTEVKTQTSSTTLNRSGFAGCSRFTVLRKITFILIKLSWSLIKLNGTFFLCGSRSENCLNKANISNTHTHTHTYIYIYMLLYSHTKLHTTHTHTNVYIFAISKLQVLRPYKIICLHRNSAFEAMSSVDIHSQKKWTNNIWTAVRLERDCLRNANRAYTGCWRHWLYKIIFLNVVFNNCGEVS